MDLIKYSTGNSAFDILCFGKKSSEVWYLAQHGCSTGFRSADSGGHGIWFQSFFTHKNTQRSPVTKAVLNDSPPVTLLKLWCIFPFISQPSAQLPQRGCEPVATLWRRLKRLFVMLNGKPHLKAWSLPCAVQTVYMHGRARWGSACCSLLVPE